MKKKILYKYFGNERNFFRDRLIRFSPRSALNDPFEIRPSAESFAMYLQSSPSFEGKSYDEILEVVIAKQEKYFHIYYGIPMLNELGVLCLTESRRSLLMWSHYANSHQGYVVGFDVTHNFFKDYRRTNYWRDYEGIGSLKPVKYDSYRSECVDCFTDWYFHKSDEWMYEKEHRLVLPLVSSDVVLRLDVNGDLSKRIDDHEEINKTKNLGHPQHICLFEVPKEALVSVTFGAGIGIELEMDVRDSIRGLNPFKIEKARYSENRFELDLI